MNFFESLLNRAKPPSGARPSWPPPRQGKFPSTWGTPKPSAPVNASTLLKGAGSFIPKGSGSLLGPLGTAATAVPTVLSIINPKDNFFTDLQNLGTSIQNQFVSPGQRRGYVGSDPAAVAANRNRYSGVIGSIPPSANGESYRDAELRLGNRGGSGGNAGYSVAPTQSRQGSYSPAAERAYQQEASRVAQLTAQDPELQRYELARQKAVAAGAGSAAEQSAEDLGMQMWAKANPTLAAKVKPGQSGYEAIQGTLVGNAARTGQGFGIQEQLVPTPQGFPTSVPGFPEGAGFGAGFNIPQALTQTPSIPFGTQQQAVQAPVAAAAQSAFGQPSVLDTEDFERLLQQLKK